MLLLGALSRSSISSHMAQAWLGSVAPVALTVSIPVSIATVAFIVSGWEHL
jgi:hypothetical protein